VFAFLTAARLPSIALRLTKAVDIIVLTLFFTMKAAKDRMTEQISEALVGNEDDGLVKPEFV
jgi:hypothetical protein